MSRLKKIQPDEYYEVDIFRQDFFLGFLDYITAHGSPIDFFSWHSYHSVERTLDMDEFFTEP